jgi:hypothetical protein
VKHFQPLGIAPEGKVAIAIQQIAGSAIREPKLAKNVPGEIRVAAGVQAVQATIGRGTTGPLGALVARPMRARSLESGAVLLAIRRDEQAQKGSRNLECV